MAERRTKAYAARYRDSEIAVATASGSALSAWSSLMRYGQSMESLEAAGWRVVPVEVVWDDGEADDD